MIRLKTQMLEVAVGHGQNLPAKTKTGHPPKTGFGFCLVSLYYKHKRVGGVVVQVAYHFALATFGESDRPSIWLRVNQLHPSPTSTNRSMDTVDTEGSP